MSTRWWRWADRDEVSRVDAYTRQSLYLLLWGSPLFLALQALARIPEDQTELALAVFVAGLVVCVPATLVLRDVMEAHPQAAPLPRRALPFLAMLAVGYVAALWLPTETRGLAVMLLWSSLAWSLAGLRGRVATGVLLAVLTVTPALAAREPISVLLGLGVGGFFIFTVRVSLWLLAVVRELDEARRTRAALAVAEERLRFSRDVHDVLGRQLSVIGVQAELAATLAERGDPGAAARMLEVRAAAHEALREARELARGYRGTDWAQELEGARSLLRSAGTEVELAVDDLPPAWHEPAAWVVREAVTNILRHSAATRVEVRYRDEELHVVNDRPVPADPSRTPAGSGLRSLAERLAPLGAALRTQHTADLFTVVTALPGTGPAAVPAERASLLDATGTGHTR
ncbi:sensor histidine kinase [Nocardioides sp. dk4132]|uniref:sensor histidine kinase n=1 Tax=unclassified Nocardioides TaxID=2615069 RepID=UPI001295CF48|nr:MULTISPECIES: histidine kinase [unclassified Nocardioides]MQW77001.1 sensor histidine kinase [Nocardioides sp. dk4132]QGA09413.1 sensor histidine kinase [Nocardioides sp. dk884]